MATDIPPHNLREVAAACIALLDDPDATTRALLKHVKGPDLPTGGEIISPRADLVSFYDSGSGSYKARAVWEIEKDSGHLIIPQLPFQVSGSRVLEQIAQKKTAARRRSCDGRGCARRIRSREIRPAW